MHRLPEERREVEAEIKNRGKKRKERDESDTLDQVGKTGRDDREGFGRGPTEKKKDKTDRLALGREKKKTVRQNHICPRSDPASY